MATGHKNMLGVFYNKEYGFYPHPRIWSFDFPTEACNKLHKTLLLNSALSHSSKDAGSHHLSGLGMFSNHPYPRDQSMLLGFRSLSEWMGSIFPGVPYSSCTAQRIIIRVSLLSSWCEVQNVVIHNILLMEHSGMYLTTNVVDPCKCIVVSFHFLECMYLSKICSTLDPLFIGLLIMVSL